MSTITAAAKVWILKCTSWNGEFDVTTIIGVFSSGEKAETSANIKREKAGTGSYSSTYEVEEYEIDA